MPINWRVQVVLPYGSNLPRDVAVNDFCIVQGSAGPTPVPDDIAAITSKWTPALTAFYNDDAGTTGVPIAQMIGPIVKRSAGACQIKYYQIGAPAGTPPYHIDTFELGPTGASSQVPLQVCIVDSIYSTHVGLRTGVLLPLARRRGRIFLGPLNNASIVETGVPLTTSQVRQSVVDQSQQLADSNNLESGDDTDDTHSSWCVFSRSGNDVSPVNHGWCEDTLYTQRRRIERTATRLSW